MLVNIRNRNTRRTRHYLRAFATRPSQDLGQQRTPLEFNTGTSSASLGLEPRARATDAGAAETRDTGLRSADARCTDGRGRNSSGSLAGVNDARAKNARAKDARTSDARGTDARGMDAKGTGSRAKDARNSDARGTDARGMDAKGTGSRAKDARNSDARGTDARGMDAKGTGSRAMNARTTEARGPNVRTDLRGTDPRASNARGTESRASDTRDTDSRAVDARGLESRDTDTQTSYSRGIYTKQEASRGTDDMDTETRAQDAKVLDVRLPRQNSVLSRPTRSKTSKPLLILALATILTWSLAPLASAVTTICGQDEWFYGYTSDYDFEYQVMDVTPDARYVVIGGTDTELNQSVLIARDMDTGSTLNHMKMLGFEAFPDVQSFNKGVLQIKVQPDGSSATALLELKYPADSDYILLVQFTLGSSSNVRTVKLRMVTPDYSQPLFLLRMPVNQFGVLFYTGTPSNSILEGYNYNFDTNTAFHQMFINTEQKYTIGDAVVSPAKSLFVVLNLNDGTHAVLQRYLSDGTTGKFTPFLKISGVNSNPSLYRLLLIDEDNFWFATLNQTGNQILVFRLFIDRRYRIHVDSSLSYSATAPGFPTTVQALGVMLTAQYSKLDVIIRDPSGFFIFKGSSSYLRDILDLSLSPHPWLTSVNYLLDQYFPDVYGLTLCWFGLSGTFIEKFCYSGQSYKCNQYFTFDQNGSSTTGSITNGIGVQTVNGLSIINNTSVNTFTVDIIFGLVDESEFDEYRIVNPCAVKAMGYVPPADVFYLGNSTPYVVDYPETQTPDTAPESCTDPSVAIGHSSSVISVEIVSLSIASSTLTISPVPTTMAEFDPTLSQIVFHLDHIDWQVDSWVLDYKVGYATSIINEEWSNVSVNSQMSFVVDQNCDSSNPTFPDQSSVPFEITQGTLDSIPLTGVSLGNCQYQVIIQSSNDPYGDIFSTEDPQFILDNLGDVLSVTAPSKVTVDPYSLDHINEFSAPNYYTVTLAMVDKSSNIVMTKTIDVTILGQTCTPSLTVPSESLEALYQQAWDPSDPSKAYAQYIFNTASNGACSYLFRIISVSPTPPNNNIQVRSPTFLPIDSRNEHQVEVSNGGYFYLVPEESIIGNTYDVDLEVYDEHGQVPLQFQTFVEILTPECSPLPSTPGTQSFTFVQGTGWHDIVLKDFNNGFCLFSITFTGTGSSDGNSQTPLTYDLSELQPTFNEPYPASIEYWEVMTPGIIKVNADSIGMIGIHENLYVQLVSDGNPVVYHILTITVEPPPCTPATVISLPSLDNAYTVVQQGDPLVIDLSNIQRDIQDCNYTLMLLVDGVEPPSGSFIQLTQATFVEDYAGFPNSSVTQDTRAMIEVTPTDLEHCNYPDQPYNFALTVTTQGPSGVDLTDTVNFTVFVEGLSCTEDPVLPSLLSSYEFTYGEGSQAIELQYTGTGNCKFDWFMSYSAEINVQNPLSPLLTFNEATFKVIDERQPTIYHIVTPYSITVSPTELEHIGEYTVSVMDNPISSTSTDFTLSIVAPLCQPAATVPYLPPIVPITITAMEEEIISLESAHDSNCVYSLTLTESALHNVLHDPFVELYQPELDVIPQIPEVVVSVTQPGSIKISPQDYGLIGQHIFELSIISIKENRDETISLQVDVIAPKCISFINGPGSISRTIAVGTPELEISLDEIQDHYCEYILTLVETSTQTEADAQLFAITQPTFSLVHELTPEYLTRDTSGFLTIAPTTKEDVGVYNMQLLVTDDYNQQAIDVTIEVVELNPCDADLQLVQIQDVVLSQDDSDWIISLDGVSNGSCQFTFELLDSKNQLADPSLFMVRQPSFESLVQRGVSMRTAGAITIAPSLPSHVGIFDLVLSIEGQLGSRETIPFEVEILPCRALQKNQETEVDILYVIGSGQQTETVKRVNEKCPNTSITIDAFDETLDLPQFITIDADLAQFTISTENDEDVVGTYAIKAMEKDNLSSLTAVTIYNIYIDSAQAIAELALKLAKKRGSSGTGSDIDGKSVQDAENNQYVEFSIEFLKQKYGYKELSSRKTPEPLKASIYDMTKTGNLTIIFSKPIILPPIELFDKQSRDSRRALTSDIDDTQIGYRNYTLKNVLTVYMESAFYEDDDKEIQVLNYNLMRLTPTALDVQVDFSQPSLITQSRVEPDIIKVDFKMSELFIDKVDFQTFKDESLILEYPVTPQYSQERLQELAKIEDALETSMGTFSIGNLILNLFLAIGLKYLWNMVTLLQFVVFMRGWLISLPDIADIFLKSLKSLALFEFLPTQKAKNVVLDWLDVENDTNDGDYEDSETLFDKLAVFILAGIAIVIAVLILLLQRLCLNSCPRVAHCYKSIKKRLFYNTFIRYVLLGTLKIQLTIGGAVFIGSVIPETPTEPAPETGFLVFGICLLIVFSLFPALFGSVLHANRGNLHKAGVKDKIGAMYFSLLAEKPWVGSYSVVFLLRRSIFVLVTFTLYRQPTMQMLVMLYTTVFYVSYISNMGFYESRNHRRIEIMNECILICVCYHFIFFADPSYQNSVREVFGTSVISFVGLLLGVNSLVIIGVNISAIKRKLALRKLKKEMEAKKAQRQAELEQKAASANQRQDGLASNNDQQQKIEAVVVRSNSTNPISLAKDNDNHQVQIKLKNDGNIQQQKSSSLLLRDIKEDADVVDKLQSFSDGAIDSNDLRVPVKATKSKKQPVKTKQTKAEKEAAYFEKLWQESRRRPNLAYQALFSDKAPVFTYEKIDLTKTNAQLAPRNGSQTDNSTKQIIVTGAPAHQSQARPQNPPQHLRQRSQINSNTLPRQQTNVTRGPSPLTTTPTNPPVSKTLPSAAAAIVRANLEDIVVEEVKQQQELPRRQEVGLHHHRGKLKKKKKSSKQNRQMTEMEQENTRLMEQMTTMIKTFIKRMDEPVKQSQADCNLPN